jgi:hypothetical protein
MQALTPNDCVVIPVYYLSVKDLEEESLISYSYVIYSLLIKFRDLETTY